MINKIQVFNCESCDAEFEIIAHSDFEEEDVHYCPLCGDPVESDEDDLLDFMGDGED